MNEIDQFEHRDRVFDAQQRERSRMITGVYKQIPEWFLNELEAINYTFYYRLKQVYFGHIAKDRTSFAYTANEEKMLADRQTVGKIGRFCSKVYNKDVEEKERLTEPQIATISNLWRQLVADEPIKLKYANGSDEIARVYNIGPRSCMAGGAHNFSTGGIHPTRVYGTEDIKLAYIKRDSRITARSLINKTNNTYCTIYGDAQTIKPLLEEAGYTQGDLTGCRVFRLDNSGNIIMPYLDGETEIYETDSHKYLHVGYLLGQSELGHANNTNGLLTSGICCDCCGERSHEDYIQFVESEDRYVCEYCLEYNYVWSEYHGEYIHKDYAVECEGVGCVDNGQEYIIECNGSYYLESDAHNHDIIEINGEWYELDEVVLCEYSQEYVLSDDATFIPSKDYYISDEYVVEFEGESYEMDSDELQEAINEHEEEGSLELQEAI